MRYDNNNLTSLLNLMTQFLRLAETFLQRYACCDTDLSRYTRVHNILTQKVGGEAQLFNCNSQTQKLFLRYSLIN